MQKLSLEKLKTAVNIGLLFKKSRKALIRDTKKDLEKAGWVEDLDLGWVINERMNECFAKKILVQVDKKSMYSNQKKYSINEVCKYLTIQKYRTLVPAKEQRTKEANRKLEQKKLEGDLQGVFEA